MNVLLGLAVVVAAFLICIPVAVMLEATIMGICSLFPGE